MSSILIRTHRHSARPATPRRPAHHGSQNRYPHDMYHPNRPWEETQRDIGGSLFLGAVTLVVLMALIGFGLLG